MISENKELHKKLIQPLLDKYEIYAMEDLNTMEDFVLSFEKDINKIWEEAQKEILEDYLKTNDKEFVKKYEKEIIKITSN